MTIEDGHNSSSSDEDVDDETCAILKSNYHGKGKGLASASGSGVVGEDEEDETFDVDEIICQSYADMEALSFRVPQNSVWRKKVSGRKWVIKGKQGQQRKKRKQNPTFLSRDAYDYRFHTKFQQDFYESVIIPKGKHVALSQWIDWNYMKRKNDT
jgi:hypothetical protein